MKNLLIEFFGENYWVVPTSLATVLTLMGLFIYIYLQKKAERAILRKEYEYIGVITEISSKIVTMYDNIEAAGYLTHQCYEGMEIECVGVYVLDKKVNKYKIKGWEGKEIGEKELVYEDILIQTLVNKTELIMSEQIKAIKGEYSSRYWDMQGGLIIPCIRGKELLGILIFGAKKNGNMYGGLEIRALKVLASQMALAIENAMVLEQQRILQAEVFSLKRMADVGFLARGVGHHIQNGLQTVSNITCKVRYDEDYEKCFDGFPELQKRHNEELEEMMYYLSDTSKVALALRDLARSESETEKEPLQVEQVIEKSLELSRLRSPRFETIEIEIEKDDGLPLIMGNFAQLQDVFFNMFNNSYDAIIWEQQNGKEKESGYRGKIRIRISSNEKEIELHIIDNGKGMSEDTKKKMFIPAFTTKGTQEVRQIRDKAEEEGKNQQTGGLGMGMYMVYMVIKAHKGDIKVEWTGEGRGTEMVVTLPIHTVPQL